MGVNGRCEYEVTVTSEQSYTSHAQADESWCGRQPVLRKKGGFS